MLKHMSRMRLFIVVALTQVLLILPEDGTDLHTPKRMLGQLPLGAFVAADVRVGTSTARTALRAPLASVPLTGLINGSSHESQ